MLGRNSIRRNFGGRGGQGFNMKNNDGRQNASTKKTLQDFIFYIGNEKQSSNYENTALFVINHIKKYFDRGNDIAETLLKLEYEITDNWNPILKASTLSDEDLKGIEDRQFELKFIAYYGEAQKLKMYYQ